MFQGFKTKTVSEADLGQKSEMNLHILVTALWAAVFFKSALSKEGILDSPGKQKTSCSNFTDREKHQLMD